MISPCSVLERFTRTRRLPCWSHMVRVHLSSEGLFSNPTRVLPVLSRRLRLTVCLSAMRDMRKAKISRPHTTARQFRLSTIWRASCRKRLARLAGSRSFKLASTMTIGVSYSVGLLVILRIGPIGHSHAIMYTLRYSGSKHRSRFYCMSAKRAHSPGTSRSVRPMVRRPPGRNTDLRPRGRSCRRGRWRGPPGSWPGESRPGRCCGPCPRRRRLPGRPARPS